MYVAIINQPGYLPEVDPVEFDTCTEAWRYIVSELEYDWDQAEANGDSDHDYLEAHTALHSWDQSRPGYVVAGGYAYSVEVAA